MCDDEYLAFIVEQNVVEIGINAMAVMLSGQ